MYYNTFYTFWTLSQYQSTTNLVKTCRPKGKLPTRILGRPKSFKTNYLGAFVCLNTDHDKVFGALNSFLVTIQQLGTTVMKGRVCKSQSSCNRPGRVTTCPRRSWTSRILRWTRPICKFSRHRTSIHLYTLYFWYTASPPCCLGTCLLMLYR